MEKTTNADIYGSKIAKFILSYDNHNFGINKYNETIFNCNTTKHTCKDCIFNVHNAPKPFGIIEYTTCQAYKAAWINMEYKPKLTENDIAFLKLISEGGSKNISFNADFPGIISLYQSDPKKGTIKFQRRVRMKDYNLTFKPLAKNVKYNIAVLLNKHENGEI